MTKKIPAYFLFVFFTVPLLAPIWAKAQAPKPEVPAVILEDYQITSDSSASGDRLKHLCPDTNFKRYAEKDICLAECDECVIDNDFCWSCQNRPEAEGKIGFWQKFKNWISGIFTPKKQPPPGSGGQGAEDTADEFGLIGKIAKRVKEIFSRAPKSAPLPEKSQLTTAADSVLAYHQEKNPVDESRIDQEINKAIATAPDLGVLLKLHSMFWLYCSDRHAGNFTDEQACQKRFMEKFRQRADQIKEELFAAIDSKDTSGDTYKKIVQLHSILMAGTNADGTGNWFSTDNIKKITAGLREKMQQWFQNALLGANLNNLYEWYALAMAHSQPREDGSMIGGGLFAGGNPLLNVQYRGRRLALQAMLEIDVCHPDPAKLKQFQGQLANPGCTKLLGDAKACDYIAKGDLESAYRRLHEKDRGDKANQELRNQAPEPIDCHKPQTTTTLESDNQTITPTAPASDQSTDPSQGGYTPSIITEEAPPVTSEPEPVSESETTDNPETTDPEPEPEPETQPEYEEPVEPLPPVEPCEVIIYEDAIIGWNFYLENCSSSYSQAYDSFMLCGSPPPLIIAEETEMENMCYETAGGFVDYNLIIPCYPAPYPPLGTAECVSQQLSVSPEN